MLNEKNQTLEFYDKDLKVTTIKKKCFSDNKHFIMKEVNKLETQIKNMVALIVFQRKMNMLT